MLTGQGTEIDVSAVETGIGLLGPVMLEVTVNERVTRGPNYPTGNRLEHPHAAPHGVYPARGHDRWVAIAVFGDEEWSRFADAIGRPAWTLDERFASQQSRWENQDALDAAVAAWTADRDRYEVTKLLQDAGVRAGAVQNAEDLNESDPQLAHRGIFFEMEHPVIGTARFEGVPIRFSDIAADNWRSGPLLGEDNDYVFRELLGVGDAEYAELAATGVDLMDTAHGAGGTPATPFADLSVVELAGDPGGETLGKLFATMGADVIKVELPEGAPSRYDRASRGRG